MSGNKTNVIVFGISGRAQSGKTTLANYIVDEIKLDIGQNYQIKQLNFATYLKKILKDLLLIDDYFLNDDFGKTQLTRYKWKDMPTTLPGNISKEAYMSGREIMEYFGALFRGVCSEAWINGLMAEIVEEKQDSVFIIPDVRAPNEVKAIKDLGGYNVRLGRNPLKRDTIIERALDQDKYGWHGFDAIINNKDMTLEEKNKLGLKHFLKLNNIELGLLYNNI